MGLSPLITLDTSGLLSFLDADDRRHAECVTVLAREAGSAVVPAGILAEIGYMVEGILGSDVLDAFLGDVEAGAFSIDCGDEDIPRIRELVRRYADLPLGFADASVIACAERNGGRVLTLDRRDFGVVAGEGKLELLP